MTLVIPSTAAYNSPGTASHSLELLPRPKLSYGPAGNGRANREYSSLRAFHLLLVLFCTGHPGLVNSGTGCRCPSQINVLSGIYRAQDAQLRLTTQAWPRPLVDGHPRYYAKVSNPILPLPATARIFFVRISWLS